MSTTPNQRHYNRLLASKAHESNDMRSVCEALAELMQAMSAWIKELGRELENDLEDLYSDARIADYIEHDWRLKERYNQLRQRREILRDAYGDLLKMLQPRDLILADALYSQGLTKLEAKLAEEYAALMQLDGRIEAVPNDLRFSVCAT